MTGPTIPQPTAMKLTLWSVAASLLLSAGCAHSKPDAAKSSEPAATTQETKPTSSGRVRLVSEEIGVSIDVPSGLGFIAGENLGVLATAPDTTELRVFLEHLPTAADEKSCWQRLYKRVGNRLVDSPRDVEEFTALATAGVPRGERFVYLAVYPKETRCYVLLGEGPKTSTILPAAIEVARRSVAIGAPSKVMSAEFEIDAGMQQLDAKEYPAAVASFERALSLYPESQRAHYGAGLAAYFAGPEHADKAIQHLQVITSASRNEENVPQLRPEQIRDALMYLGLAYAAKHQYPRAMSTLAELVARTPGDATGRYNLACVLALSGDGDSAMGELADALEQEPSLIDHAQKDDDLKSLRERADWRELFQKLTTAPSRRGRR